MNEPDVCTHRNCPRPEQGKTGLCNGHYQRKLRGRDMDNPPLRRSSKFPGVCITPGCGVVGSSLRQNRCPRHYAQWKNSNPETIDSRPFEDTVCRRTDCKNVATGRSDLCKSHRQHSWRYSMTSDEYVALFEDPKCTICGLDDASKLTIDHDHTCCPQDYGTCGNCNRGLLCRNCNLAIGLLKEDVNRFKSAIRYLER